MDSNYKWQQQAKDRLQARMREAEAHRLLKSNTVRRDSLLIRIWKKLHMGSASGKQTKRLEAGTAEADFKPRMADQAAEQT
jgi:hypothetical protein